MEAFEILVIILSVALAIFLILGIVFMVYLIRISRRVHEISETARSAVDNVESAAKVFSKAAGPAAFSRIVANIVETWQSSKDDKKRR
jgi:hypothetical protein